MNGKDKVYIVISSTKLSHSTNGKQQSSPRSKPSSLKKEPLLAKRLLRKMTWSYDLHALNCS
jgi:hypothetical protein